MAYYLIKLISTDGETEVDASVNVKNDLHTPMMATTSVRAALKQTMPELTFSVKSIELCDSKPPPASERLRARGEAEGWLDDDNVEKLRRPMATGRPDKRK